MGLSLDKGLITDTIFLMQVKVCAGLRCTQQRVQVVPPWGRRKMPRLGHPWVFTGWHALLIFGRRGISVVASEETSPRTRWQRAH